MSQYNLEITEDQSSLVAGIDYDDETHELKVRFHKYYVPYLIYIKVGKAMFTAFSNAESFGKFYLTYIKNSYHLKTNKMSDNAKTKPKGINKAKKEKRYILLSLDVTKINKDWLFVGKEGIYLKAKLHLLPDGEVDKFECLGMVTQEVPKEIYEKEKSDGVSKSEMTQGPILGNGQELDWQGSSSERSPSADLGKAGGAEDEKLPF